MYSSIALDGRWVTRRYGHYLGQKGHSCLEDVTMEEVRDYILQTATEVRASSLHNILLYLKHFHIFLKENDISAPDCVELFSYKVYREMPVQGCITDEDLQRIYDVIDVDTVMGKRDLAIIELAATTGLRAVDIIKLTLDDIDWDKAEIHTIQSKTGRAVSLPLINDAADALADYINNGRPDSQSNLIFLRTNPPCYPISDSSSIGYMFRSYEKKAGIVRQALDGKGFHGLRRHLAKKLLITGTPITSIAQILGHERLESVRQYLSLDTSNIKECALSFKGIELRRKELL